MENLVVEHDVLTDTVIEREMTADEIKLRKLIDKEIAKSKAEQDARANARESALAKLADLGLTAEEIAAL